MGITKGEILSEAAIKLGIQSGKEIINPELNKGIQLTYELDLKKTNIVRHASGSTTSTVTCFTTLTNKDFYLTFLWAAITKDVTNDTVGTIIQFNCDGAIRAITQPLQPLTAESKALFLNFNEYPIKLERGSSITLAMTFAAGAGKKDITIGGFYLE
jgi:hypothetical protein